MFMHDWPKFAICTQSQTCLESSKTPRTPLGELTTLPRPVVELAAARGGLAHLKDLMAPVKHLLC